MIDMKVLILFALFSLSQVRADCFDYDTDYYGTNINNGLEERTDSAKDCQRHCQTTDGCVAFTWASKNFPDTDYRNACWLKGHVEYPFSKGEAISGPKECPTPTQPTPPDGPCCSRINFSSTGDWGSIQHHVLGDYVYAGEGPEGHWNYEQTQTNEVGIKDKLYFFPYLQAWYIGNKFDVNMGYAYNQQTTQCPEDLDHGWQWTDGEQWIDDPQAKFTCAEVKPTTLPPPSTLPPTTLPPIPDFCVSGSMCNDCSLTAGYQGVTYCCNNDCNYGWINVDPTTNPLCQCGHE